MSQAMKGLVETSNNLAIVRCNKGKFEAYNLCRSSVDSAKEATAWRIAAAFHLIDADVKLEGGYPGWKPNMQSPILQTMSNVYKDMFGNIPEKKAIHAGLGMRSYWRCLSKSRYDFIRTDDQVSAFS